MTALKGKGQFVGVYLAWGVNNNGWWGEGEIKFYMDGDTKFPTICGTGTEDYFCGSYNFDREGQDILNSVLRTAVLYQVISLMDTTSHSSDSDFTDGILWIRYVLSQT